MAVIDGNQNVKFANYYYNKQIINYILQFMAVFSDMQVAIGKNDNNSTTNLIRVPIRYGDADRVVNSIIESNTQNKPISLPIFSAYLSDFQLRTDSQKGIGAIERDTFMPVGGTFPNDLQTVMRRVPTPYKAIFELGLYSSNNDQKFQIMEQLCSLFDPIVQIQTSDNPFSWSRISTLILERIIYDNNFPSEVDKRIIKVTFEFSTTIWLQVPINFKQDFITSINLRLSKLTGPDYIIDVNDTNIPYQEIINGDDGTFFTQ